MIPASAIGLLDSGVGGLSVLREIRRQLPSESILYYADQGHLPYGEKSRAEIRSYVHAIADFLIERGCKAIVVACNTANAAALHYLRETHPGFPIIGMEPAVKPAAKATRTGVIGVITTRVTYQSELYASVLDRFAQNVRVETQVCPGFVHLAEQGASDTPEVAATVEDYLAPLKAANIDQLVLGCTHFPFLEKQIRRYLGDGVTIIDPAPAVARQTGRVLSELHLAASPDQQPRITYFTSGDPAVFRQALHTLIGAETDTDPVLLSPPL